MGVGVFRLVGCFVLCVLLVSVTPVCAMEIEECVYCGDFENIVHNKDNIAEKTMLDSESGVMSVKILPKEEILNFSSETGKQKVLSPFYKDPLFWVGALLVILAVISKVWVLWDEKCLTGLNKEMGEYAAQTRMYEKYQAFIFSERLGYNPGFNAIDAVVEGYYHTQLPIMFNGMEMIGRNSPYDLIGNSLSQYTLNVIAPRYRVDPGTISNIQRRVMELHYSKIVEYKDKFERKMGEIIRKTRLHLAVHLLSGILAVSGVALMIYSYLKNKYE